ncbi:TetR/AcrR family transcriptional regulator [Amycolatopsis taiwanensis]|uniref:TetR/AcrR family transcriptional regulator n=1 Tax=Amycolatopsis taiwanensis TaxID=342230 RepID=UPI0004ADBD27|nr:helix-turn-helix domain-containing protein [Amycolatopsis taiwanensis]
MEMSTRERILCTAERLFATQGIDATSLRQISAAAGQRNTAAAKYHFTTKRALIRAIFDHRLEVIDARRRELVKLAEDAGRLSEPWHLVEVLVRPLAEQATEPGSHYVRFLDAVLEYIGRDVTALPEIGGLEDAVAVGRLVADRLPALSQPRTRARVQWAGQLIVAALADLERQGTAMSKTERPDLEPVALALIDAVTGLLTAPVTDAGSART